MLAELSEQPRPCREPRRLISQWQDVPHGGDHGPVGEFHPDTGLLAGVQSCGDISEEPPGLLFRPGRGLDVRGGRRDRFDGTPGTFAGFAAVSQQRGLCDHGRMDEMASSEIEVSPAAEMRYDDPDVVKRVLVRVEYGDGKVREYEAREPQDFDMNDPESLASMTVRKTGLPVGAGGGFVPMSAAVPSLRLSFTANPRYNLHIRTERTAAPSGVAGGEPVTVPVVQVQAEPPELPQ